MAIFNTLVTATKLLVKNMAKKKLKEKAKKFVTGSKDKDKKKKSAKEGDKKIKKETFLQSQQRKVAEMKASPNYKPLKSTKLMNTDADKIAKVKPDSAKIDYNLFTEKVDNIVGMTNALVFLTGAQSDQKKSEIELLRQRRQEEKRKNKEKKLERKNQLLDKTGKGIKKIAQDPLDRMIKFLTNIVIGSLAVFLLNNVEKIKKFFQVIGENLELFSKLLRVSIFGFQQAMVLANKGLKIAGQGLKKVLSPIGKAFKAIGSKIKSVFKSLGGKFLKLLKKIPGVKGLTNLIKGIGKTLTAAKTAVTATKTAAKKVVKKTVSKATKPVTKAVSKVTKPVTKTISKVSKPVTKVASGVLKKGVAKAPGRLLIKLFGKNTAQMVANSGKLFKTLAKGAKAIKIPILGPIIVAITSILSGDNSEKTMFKTLGTVFGGMIGGGLGAALGGLGAPFGMLIGEIVGEFIGDLLYNVIRGDDDGTKGVEFLKKKFGQILTGAGNAAKSVMNFAMSMLGKFGNFFEDGFDRFIENFPTLDISKMRLGIGVASVGAPWALGKLVSLIPGDPFKGMKNSKGEINKIPDLGLLTPFGIHKLLPHLKNSFFPSGEKEQIPESSISGGGGEEEEATTAVVETSDNTDDYTLEDILDDAKKDAASSSKTTAAQLGEKDTSSTSSTVSDVSSKASYEEVPAGTVILEKPQRSDFNRGKTGNQKFKQAMTMYNNQKEMLNSYQKAHAATELAKI